MSRRNPFERMAQMEEMLNRIRRSMLRSDPFSTAPQLESGSETEISPETRSEMNLTVDPVEDGYIVTADLPGFEKDEIDLRFDDGMLSIRGVHDTSEETTEEGMISRRSQQRQAHKQVRLPTGIDEDAISAAYRNGVLEVQLPTLDDEGEEDSSRIEID